MNRLIDRLAGTLPQAESFHNAHALYVFQKAGHKICLCRLPPGGKAFGGSLDAGINQHGHGKARKHQQTNMPFIKQQPYPDHNGVDKSAGRPFQYGDRIVLNVSKGGSRSGSDFTQPVFAEISHGDALHMLANLQPLLGAHGKAAQGPLDTGQVVKENAPRNADDHNTQ